MSDYTSISVKESEKIKIQRVMEAEDIDMRIGEFIEHCILQQVKDKPNKPAESSVEQQLQTLNTTLEENNDLLMRITNESEVAATQDDLIERLDAINESISNLPSGNGNNENTDMSKIDARLDEITKTIQHIETTLNSLS